MCRHTPRWVNYIVRVSLDVIEAASQRVMLEIPSNRFLCELITYFGAQEKPTCWKFYWSKIVLATFG